MTAAPAVEKCTLAPLKSRSLLRILTVQHQISPGLLQRPFDQTSRHAQTPVVAEHGANRSAGFDAVRCGVGETHPVENPEGVVRDGRNAGSGQGLELSAGLPRSNRLDRFGQGRRARALYRLIVEARPFYRRPGSLVCEAWQHL